HGRRQPATGPFAVRHLLASPPEQGRGARRMARRRVTARPASFGAPGGGGIGLLGQVLRFGLVGLLGFALDTGLTVALERGASLPPFAARPPAIVAAMLATWWLNRGFSFRVAAPLSSLGRYALVVAF